MVTIGIQAAFPLLNDFRHFNGNDIGARGEQIVAHALQQSGYKVSTAHDIGDLTVVSPQGEILYVEVKTARRSVDKKWRFLLFKVGSQDHRKADIVVLLCLLKSGDAVPFVVPRSALTHKHQACISSMPQSYRGYLARYRQSIRRMTLEGVCNGE